jgi:hypothetical protein
LRFGSRIEGATPKKITQNHLPMTITAALQESAKTQNAHRFTRLLNKMERKGMDVMCIPLICDVNRVGIKAHQWAWDQLEDWQTE